jgi:Mg2+/Co2+ transporter CorB
MTVPLAPTLVAVVALLCCSAFFSSSETALFSLPRDWLAEAAKTDPRAASVEEVLSDPHRLLVTLLVGNNVVNITLSSLLTALLVDRLDPGLAVVATTVVASTLVLIGGEILPKAYGLGQAKSFAPRIVRPLRYVELLLYPVVTVFDLLTRTVSDRIGGQQSIERTYDEVE